jgi:hypothetical protein
VKRLVEFDISSTLDELASPCGLEELASPCLFNEIADSCWIE